MKKVVFTALLLITWEVIAVFSSVSETVFPRLSQVLLAMVQKPELLIGAVYSLSSIILAIILCFLISAIFLAGSAAFPLVKEVLDYFCSLLGPIPGAAILPIIIVWSGLGFRSLVIILLHSSVWAIWPLLSNSLLSLQLKYRRLLAAYKIPIKNQILGVFIPGLSRQWLSALEIAWSRSWRALIAAEMLFGVSGTHTGIGREIYERRMYMDTEGMFAAVLLIALTGIVFESFIKRLGNCSYE